MDIESKVFNWELLAFLKVLGLLDSFIEKSNLVFFLRRSLDLSWSKNATYPNFLIILSFIVIKFSGLVLTNGGLLSKFNRSTEDFLS